MTQINAAANTAQSKPLNRARTEASCSGYSPFSASWNGTRAGPTAAIERGYRSSL